MSRAQTPSPYHKAGHSTEYGSRRQGVGSEKQRATIIQIEIPYKAKPAVGIWLIILEEAPFLRRIADRDS